jgi:Kef-type K+ transport system membrane component KefB
MRMRWLRFWAFRKEAGGYVGGTILGIGVILFLSFFFAALFERSRIPDVLLLTLVGIVLGPLTHWVQPQDWARSVGCSVLLLWS